MGGIERGNLKAESSDPEDVEPETVGQQILGATGMEGKGELDDWAAKMVGGSRQADKVAENDVRASLANAASPEQAQSPVMGKAPDRVVIAFQESDGRWLLEVDDRKFSFDERDKYQAQQADAYAAKLRDDGKNKEEICEALDHFIKTGQELPASQAKSSDSIWNRVKRMFGRG